MSQILREQRFCIIECGDDGNASVLFLLASLMKAGTAKGSVQRRRPRKGLGDFSTEQRSEKLFHAL
jgi:hypothetical protein